MTQTRPLQTSDWDDWKRLWTGYLTYYETSVAEEIYEVTFNRLLGDDPQDFSGILAEKDGKIIGLTHYRALIEAVYKAADDAEAPSVYWLTQDFNKTARTLYDRIGKKTPFIRYSRA